MRSNKSTFFSFGNVFLNRMGGDTTLQENIVATACVLLVIAFIVFLLVVARTIVVKWPRLSEDLLEVEPICDQMEVWSVHQTEACTSDSTSPETEKFIKH